jgi:hypothetical protein
MLHIGQGITVYTQFSVTYTYNIYICRIGFWIYNCVVMTGKILSQICFMYETYTEMINYRWESFGLEVVSGTCGGISIEQSTVQIDRHNCV